MEKEIKFRAWHKKDKKMWFPTLISFGLPPNSIYSYGGKDDKVPHYPDECVLMQFTVLKDKKGVEIYEGDVVKAIGFEDEDTIRQIKWFGDEGYPAFDLEPAIDMLECNALSFAEQGNEGAEIEIIGNIYQKPELIKGENK